MLSGQVATPRSVSGVTIGAQQDAGHQEAGTRQRQRNVHRATEQGGDRDRQYRTRNQSRRNAQKDECYAAGRCDKHRLCRGEQIAQR